ncbi:MAG: 23S rRNA (guanosine(2251)-2'-O)-methyltransferase RlmB [Alphaproteobacteria bacterium]|nr:23S rRNA (guanosine(2251)-2'-O)-methyltransferase RlmB [Alphaproteobacteria bacterium]
MIKKSKNLKHPPSKKIPYVFGLHAVKAALSNSERRCHHLWVIPEVHEKLKHEGLLASHPELRIEITDIQTLDSKGGDSATHQGIVLQADPLARVHLEDKLTHLPDQALIVVLDQISDPHYVGSIRQSAAAFGAFAVIQPDDHTPNLSNPIIAKVASGALEHVPLINVTNLARALQMLKEEGFWLVGLDERGIQNLSEVKVGGRLAIVLGSEDKGMRRLTRENCDILASLPTSPQFPTLNVSNAAAISLYEFARRT